MYWSLFWNDWEWCELCVCGLLRDNFIFLYTCLTQGPFPLHYCLQRDAFVKGPKHRLLHFYFPYMKQILTVEFLRETEARFKWNTCGGHVCVEDNFWGSVYYLTITLFWDWVSLIPAVWGPGLLTHQLPGIFLVSAFHLTAYRQGYRQVLLHPAFCSVLGIRLGTRLAQQVLSCTEPSQCVWRTGVPGGQRHLGSPEVRVLVSCQIWVLWTKLSTIYVSTDFIIFKIFFYAYISV